MDTLTLTALISLAVSTAVSGFIGFLYNRSLQKLKFQDDYRQKAKIVAELFSQWYRGGPHTNRALTQDEFIQINKLCWECSFWLPDNIIQHIRDRLTNQAGAPDLKEILVEVRQYLNPEMDPIDWHSIVHF